MKADLKIFATYSTHLGSCIIGCMFIFFEKRQATHPQLSPLLRTAVNNLTDARSRIGSGHGATRRFGGART